MNASLRPSRATRSRDELFRIAAVSLIVFGIVSFGVGDPNKPVVWVFRVIAFGLAGTLYFLVTRKGTHQLEGETPRFENGRLKMAGVSIDPRSTTAASITRRDSVGIVHLWEGEHETILTVDAEVLAILSGALRSKVLRAPRTYLPSGPLRPIGQLFVDTDGLRFPTDWVRGQGMTKMEEIAWRDIKRVFAQESFLVIERVDGKLLGPGVSVAADIEELVIDEILAMRSPPAKDPVPAGVIAALPSLASGRERDETVPYREAPMISPDDLLAALARGPVESRLLAAKVLVARGTIPEGAIAYVERGLRVGKK